MEVKVGIVQTARELVVDTPASADEVQQALAAAVADSSVFELTDDKGRKVLVPAVQIAYLEIGDARERRMGFDTL